MKYDITKFEALVEQGLLRKSEKGDLVLYGYTDKCTFERAWDEYTRIARGLILNKTTGELVAKPFPKFFNLGEMSETHLSKLPTGSGYVVFEKVDGSLGVVYHYDGQWNIATRGSFYSDQAVRGQDILQKYDLSKIPTTVTLLVEIIYPQNRIIIDYGSDEKLVLLGAYEVEYGLEVSPNGVFDFARLTGMERTKTYDYTIEQMIEMQKTLPKTQEGFVVRFYAGLTALRVKIKGNEYMKIAKILAHMSPLAFWESMVGGMVDKTYLAQIPEEFRPIYEPMVIELERQYTNLYLEISSEYIRLPVGGTSPEERKALGLFLQSDTTLKHKAAMFPCLLEDRKAVNKYIMKLIRPKGNVLI